MPTLTIIRGLPSSGKTTHAKKMQEQNSNLVMCAADDFFMINGEYKFDPKKIMEAHKDCQRRTEESLRAGNDVVVHNTFTQKWEIDPYFQIAYRVAPNVQITIVSLFDGGLSDEQLCARNAHAVPLNVIAAMRSRWENF